MKMFSFNVEIDFLLLEILVSRARMGHACAVVKGNRTMNPCDMHKLELATDKNACIEGHSFPSWCSTITFLFQLTLVNRCERMPRSGPGGVAA